jgi:hypothetical protein
LFLTFAFLHRKATLYELRQSFHGRLGVVSLCLQNQFCSLGRSQSEQIDNAARLDAAIISHQLNARLKLPGQSREHIGRARVEPLRIGYHNHARYPVSLHLAASSRDARFQRPQQNRLPVNMRAGDIT